MTAAIKASLSNLDKALQSLEKSAVDMQDKQKNSKKSSGLDLFSVAPAATASNDVDAKALASRLDGAIAKVERLLREGEAHG